MKDEIKKLAVHLTPTITKAFILIDNGEKYQFFFTDKFEKAGFYKKPNDFFMDNKKLSDNLKISFENTNYVGIMGLKLRILPFDGLKFSKYINLNIEKYYSAINALDNSELIFNSTRVKFPVFMANSSAPIQIDYFCGKDIILKIEMPEYYNEQNKDEYFYLYNGTISINFLTKKDLTKEEIQEELQRLQQDINIIKQYNKNNKN